ncbi:MAG: T9SS type A sorting domain-containing protein [Chitinophagales bacterium]|nr:T9SS type A sorting domain-containing protein [Chitinophagales bacterium]
MRSFLYFVTFMFSPFVLISQPWYSKSIDIDNLNNTGWQILVEGEELILSSPNYCNANTTQTCTFLVKTDWEGNYIDHVVIDSHRVASLKNPIIKSSDSTFHVYMSPSPYEESNIHILKLDNDLEVLEEWNFGAEQENELPYYWVQHENGFLATSLAYSEEESEYTSWFTFFDKDMEVVNQAMFPEWESEYGLMMDDDLIATQDGNFVSSGRLITTSPDNETVTKYNEEMDILWHARLENQPLHINEHASLVELENGNIVANWEQINNTNPYNDSLSSMHLRMVCLDGNTGDTVWTNTMWMPRPAYPYVFKLNRANNGDIIGLGSIYRPPGPEEWLEAWDNAAFIFRMSPEGELKWKRYILDTKSPLADLGHFINSANLPNGDLLFIGSYQDTFPNHEPTINNPNIWLVRTDSMGCLIPGCGDLQIVTDSTILTNTKELIVSEKEYFMARVYPNPAIEYWTLEWGYSAQGYLQLLDLNGRLIHAQDIQNGTQQIPAKNIPPGLYFMHINSKEASGSFKVIKW